MSIEEDNYRSDFKRLRHYLHAAQYKRALHALKIAPDYHPDYRKDGKTPNFHHQVEVALSLYDDRWRIKRAGFNVDVVIAGGLFHDTPEDRPDAMPVIKREFDSNVVTICQRLDKNDMVPFPRKTGHALTFNDIFLKQTLQELGDHGWNFHELGKILFYFNRLLEMGETVIIKLHDRRSNIHTVSWLPARNQPQYILETRMLSNVAYRAIRLYPKLEGLIQHSRKQMRNSVNLYLDVNQKFFNDMLKTYGGIIEMGESGEIITLLNASGLIRAPNEPQPNSWRVPPRRQVAP
ncbi:MAG: hypothetical protein PHY92_04335 [Alphaproteobacteria bacterium]|nr:hypothetical protein [Alphaproteobacteria bacterium]